MTQPPPPLLKANGAIKNTTDAIAKPNVNSVLLVNLARIIVMINNTTPIKKRIPPIIFLFSFFMAFRFRNTQQI